MIAFNDSFRARPQEEDSGRGNHPVHDSGAWKEAALRYAHSRPVNVQDNSPVSASDNYQPFLVRVDAETGPDGRVLVGREGR